jgi:hypothetical protein
MSVTYQTQSEQARGQIAFALVMVVTLSLFTAGFLFVINRVSRPQPEVQTAPLDYFNYSEEEDPFQGNPEVKKWRSDQMFKNRMQCETDESVFVYELGPGVWKAECRKDGRRV